MSSESDSDNDCSVIALDNGSSTCRIGFAGDDAPKAVFPNYIGRPLYKNDHASKDEFFVGDGAQARRNVLSLTYPVQRGIVTNWDDMEEIWQHSFEKELGLESSSLSDHSIITGEPPLNPRSHPEKMAQVLFESFNFSGVHIGLEPHFILYSAGRGSGVAVHVGQGVSYAASIYEGASRVGECRSDFGGHDVTLKLQELLMRRGYSFTTTAELDSLSEAKNSLCYVAPAPGSETQNSQGNSGKLGESSKDFQLPDGTTIQLDFELHEACELFFKPDGVFNTGPSISDMVLACLHEGDIDTRPDLFVNNILSGGSTMTRGFHERIAHDLKKEISPTMRVTVVGNPERKYHKWIGKSIEGSLSSFQGLKMSKSEYEEYGPLLVHGRGTRCLLP